MSNVITVELQYCCND